VKSGGLARHTRRHPVCTERRGLNSGRRSSFFFSEFTFKMAMSGYELAGRVPCIARSRTGGRPVLWRIVMQ
jgi:hypothetical protein